MQQSTKDSNYEYLSSAETAAGKVPNQFRKRDARSYFGLLSLPSKGRTNEAVSEVRKIAVKTKMVSAMAWALEHCAT